MIIRLKIVKTDTREEFEKKWTRYINVFIRLRPLLPEIHQEDLTRSICMLQTLVGVASVEHFKEKA